MMLYTTILIKSFFAGVASLGFAVLFNVPRRVLKSIFFIAALGGFVKFLALTYDLSLVWSSLVAGIMIGVLSVPFARMKHTPPLILAIPGVISMVPGAYIYRSILGMIDIATANGDIPPELITETIHNAMFSMFILIAISVGAGIPTIITRRQIMTSVEAVDE